MAKGWESKGIEDQMNELERQRELNENQPQLTGSEEEKRAALADKAKQARVRADLELQLQYFENQRTSSPVRRAALEAAIEDIESKLSKLKA